MTGLDIPAGTKMNKVLTGGDSAFKSILEFVKKINFSGYVLVKFQDKQEDISSFLLYNNARPTFGIREVITQADSSKKRIRKIYAGPNTIEDVKQDFRRKNASIEFHSDVNVDEIINRFHKGKKQKKKETVEKVQKIKRPPVIQTPPDSRRVGLFWGSGGDTESLERNVLSEKLMDWKSKGYNVSKLEKMMPGDLKNAQTAFAQFEDNIATLEELAAELELFTLAGFEAEVKLLKPKLKDPAEIPTIKAQIEILEERASKTKTEEKPLKPEKICIVCGFPLKDEKKCPRCGAWAANGGQKVMIQSTVSLHPGRCYLLEEDKMQRTLEIFLGMTRGGYSGFVITRTNPRYLRENYPLTKSKLLWLTDKESSTESTIPPVLERIIYEMGNYLKSQEKICIVMDGIEYLVSNNGFDPVLRFIRRLIDDISESKSILLITVGPATLKPQELKILEREMEKISSEAPGE